MTLQFKDIPIFLYGELYRSFQSQDYTSNDDVEELRSNVVFNEKIDNFSQFQKLLEVEDYWDVDNYSISLYAYAIMNYREVIAYLKSFLLQGTYVGKTLYDNLTQGDAIIYYKRDILSYLQRHYLNDPNYLLFLNEFKRTLSYGIGFHYLDDVVNNIELIILINGVQSFKLFIDTPLDFDNNINNNAFKPQELIDHILQGQSYSIAISFRDDEPLDQIEFNLESNLLIIRNDINNSELKIQLTIYNVEKIINDLQNIEKLFNYYLTLNPEVFPKPAEVIYQPEVFDTAPFGPPANGPFGQLSFSQPPFGFSANGPFVPSFTEFKNKMKLIYQPTGFAGEIADDENTIISPLLRVSA